MSFYDLPKEEREKVVAEIYHLLLGELKRGEFEKTFLLCMDEDTYIRKNTYLCLGRIYSAHLKLKPTLIKLIEDLMSHDDYRTRQTAINAAGEIGKFEFEKVQFIFDKGLFDKHHSPRNAVIGSIKKMGEANPLPVLKWARSYLHHQDKEIRREICHGIELRGRKHPEDILPFLKELQFDKTARVRKTLVHVLGQIAYKKDCLRKVVDHLNTWENEQLVSEALEEIIDVHNRYRNFSTFTQKEAIAFIQLHAKSNLNL